MGNVSNIRAHVWAWEEKCAGELIPVGLLHLRLGTKIKDLVTKRAVS